MRIVRSKTELNRIIEEFRRDHPGELVGFVPTMGYLHAGHSSLIDHSRNASGFTVVSIFVNPTQFGPGEDYERYPRNEVRDLEICLQHGADLVFLPDTHEMYTPGHATFVQIRGMSEVLCGQFRPGHFEGVATIVAKLFNLIRPDIAFFGQKDGQQVAIVKKMARDLDFHVRIDVISTIREPDGLAMSSRNVYLSKNARRLAPLLYSSLCQARDQFVDHQLRDGKTLVATVRRALEDTPEIKIQYIEIRTVENLDSVDSVTVPVILAVSVILERVRLIDNIILNPGDIGNDSP